MARSLFFVLLLWLSPSALAGNAPSAGSYGFNWLSAEPTCRKFSTAQRVALKNCTVSSDAFGLNVRSHVCRVNRRTEYMIYSSAAKCRDALETMQANAP